MKTILIVEDNTDIHNLLKEVLEKENYRVLNSYSGTEALMVLEKKVDLILLDLMLPGLNGEEKTKEGEIHGIKNDLWKNRNRKK